MNSQQTKRHYGGDELKEPNKKHHIHPIPHLQKPLNSSGETCIQLSSLSRSLGKPPDAAIVSIGCTFSVYRKRQRDQVVTVSFWKSKPGYIFNLSQSILLWPTMIQQFFGDKWNIRFYLDDSILSRLPDSDIDRWMEIIQSILKHKNVEVWMFDCASFKKRASVQDSRGHRGTFASLVRFQPLFEPDVRVCVSRNLELLTSCQDGSICNAFASDDTKQYLIYAISGYNCHYGEDICLRATMDPSYREGMILAWFGCKVKLTEQEWQNWITWTQKIGIYEQQAYGIDEIFLWKMFKRQLTPQNTKAANVFMATFCAFADVPDENLSPDTLTDKGEPIPSIYSIVRILAERIFIDSTDKHCDYTLVDFDEPDYTKRENVYNRQVLQALQEKRPIDITSSRDLFNAFLDRIDGCSDIAGQFLKTVHFNIRPRTKLEEAYVIAATETINTEVVMALCENREVLYFEDLLTKPSIAQFGVGINPTRAMQLLMFVNVRDGINMPSDFVGFGFKDKLLSRDAMFRNKKAFTRMIGWRDYPCFLRDGQDSPLPRLGKK